MFIDGYLKFSFVFIDSVKIKFAVKLQNQFRKVIILVQGYVARVNDPKLFEFASLETLKLVK